MEKSHKTTENYQVSLSLIEIRVENYGKFNLFEHKSLSFSPCATRDCYSLDKNELNAQQFGSTQFVPILVVVEDF